MAVLVLTTAIIVATPLSTLSSALQSRNLVQGMDCMQSLGLSDIGSNQFISQLCRSSVSLTSSIIDTPDFLMSIITLPPSFSMPLHSRPGVVLSKLLHGTLTLRNLDILQFVTDDELLNSKSFSHEDAFAGEDDCVCRGGKCPRRDGCIFWVNKMLRDSDSSLFVTERGYTTVGAGECEMIQDTVGPRELINSGQTSAIYIDILMKDLDQADMIEDVPVLQYYRADRVDGAGVKGNKLKVYASNEPLGLIPMYVPWRGNRE